MDQIPIIRKDNQINYFIGKNDLPQSNYGGPGFVAKMEVHIEIVRFYEFKHSNQE